MGPYFLTHRCVFSSFSQVEVHQKARLLRDHGISPVIKAHNDNLQTGTLGQLPQYQVAYDLYVPNREYDLAQGLV